MKNMIPKKGPLWAFCSAVLGKKLLTFFNIPNISPTGPASPRDLLQQHRPPYRQQIQRQRLLHHHLCIKYRDH